MKKNFLITFMILNLIYLGNIMTTYAESQSEPAKNYTPVPNLALHLDQIRRIEENKLEFDVYLERVELNLKQEKKDPMTLTVDLPLELQPRLMYVSEPDDKEPENGSMCDRPRFPHRCEVTLKKNEKEKTVRIKITFEDNAYAEKLLTVKAPKPLNNPKILNPKKAPEKGSKLKMRFRNVLADQYEVNVDLCKEYGNDGINPCLDSIQYNLKKINGKLVIQNNNQSFPAKIIEKKRYIEITSDFPLNYSESVTYAVKAFSEKTTKNGIKTYRERNTWINLK